MTRQGLKNFWDNLVTMYDRKPTIPSIILMIAQISVMLFASLTTLLAMVAAVLYFFSSLGLLALTLMGFGWCIYLVGTGKDQ